MWLGKKGSGKHNSCLAVEDTEAARGHGHWMGGGENHTSWASLGEAKSQGSLCQKSPGRSTGQESMDVAKWRPQSQV